MKKRVVDYIIEQSDCIPNGSKEACIKVREYLKYLKLDKDNISSPICDVTNEEFIDAVKVLMAFAWQNKDKDCVPETWYCDNACQNIDLDAICLFCNGEFQLAKKDEQGKNLSKKLCPYFVDSSDK